MKLLTANFISCPVRTCKTSPASFPLHFKDCEIAIDPDGNPYSRGTLLGVLPRLEWDALRTSARELGFTELPVEKPEGEEVGEEILKLIWELLVQVCFMLGWGWWGGIYGGGGLILRIDAGSDWEDGLWELFI